MFLFVLCLLISIHLVHSSRGDRSVPYQGCISSCLQQHLCNPDFGDISWAFLSCARCRYKCVWDTVTYFQRHNEEVPQFHGKWPFVALDVPSIGVFIQEPASTLFSIGNLLGMITMYRRIQQANLRYGSTMWSLYSLVGITTWICSTAFHCIDIRLTEYLDYFSAFGFVIFAMYASTHVVFSELSSSTNGKTFSKFLAVICFGFYSNHIFQMINHFDYGWNMTCCIICSAVTSFLYIFYLTKRYRRFYRISQSDYALIKMLIIGNCSVLMEVLEFTPIFWTFDSHALFHLGTIPLPFIFSSFIVNQDRENVDLIAAKNV